ncbi:MAG: cupin domain-containing protein [Alphaproteobacteria bacterium]|nr:cupin domain-containing protein [Alphaproteobacteria bacterium]
MIRHHPSDTTLVGHAAGTLLPLHAQVLGLHLAQCPACRRAIGVGEELGGALLEAEPPVAMANDALARATARLDAMPVEPPRVAARAVSPGLDAWMRGRRWRPVGLGIKLMPLVPRDATGTRLDLIRVSPGVALPRHEHTGPEIACILEGGFADATGEYHVGDIAEGDVGLDHQPRALAGEECVCLIATTGYLRARSRLVRLLQPVFGI